MKKNNLAYFISFIQTKTGNADVRMHIALANHILFYCSENNIIIESNLEKIKNDLIDVVRMYEPVDREKNIKKCLNLMKQEFKKFDKIINDLQNDGIEYIENAECENYLKNIVNKNFTEFISNI